MQMGLLQAAQFSPFLVVTLFAGVLIDRYRQRPILAGANIASALVLAIVPALAYFGRLDMPLLYVVSMALGVLAVFLNLSFTSFLPSIVATDDLVCANARMELSRNTAQTFGPAVGAWLLSIMPAPSALLFNALTFVCGALGVAAVRGLEPQPQSRQKRDFLAELSEGLRFTFQHQQLRTLVLLAGIFNFFYQAIATLFVLYAARTLAIGNAEIGLVFSIGSLGGVLGALVSDWGARIFGLGRSLVVLTFFGCSGLSLVPLASPHSSFAFIMCAAGYCFMNFGISAFNVQSVALRQIVAPPGLLGRVAASARAIVFGAIPLGALIAGCAAQRFGTYPVMCCGAAALVLTWAFFALSPIRNFDLRQTLRPIES
jgi:Na+/melibiose symporter-like transporter